MTILYDDFVKKITDFIDQVEQRKLPKEFPELPIPDLIFEISFIKYRRNYIDRVGFVMLYEDWIKPLCEFLKNKKCLEVMAGSGALTYFIKERGIDIIATDIKKHEPYLGKDVSWNEWVDIKKIDSSAAVKKYGKDVDYVLMSWPPFDDSAYNTLQTMRKVNPNTKLIYIGDPSCDCTANDKFLKSYKTVEDLQFKKVARKFKPWKSYWDRLLLIN